MRERDRKAVFHSLQADIVTSCLAVWPLSTLITHFEYVCVLLSVFHPSMWIFPLFVYERACVSLCLCTCTPLMKLRLLLLPFILLLLMLSHFLWAPDKPTKQGENRALYWDACQDSPWIYGQQTAFITQPREAEKKRAGGERRGGKRKTE